MTANEHYEHDWNAYLKHLQSNPKTTLMSFVRSRHTSTKGMRRWMARRHLSVKAAKESVLSCFNPASGHDVHAMDASGSIFVPLSDAPVGRPSSSGDVLAGISITFPEGIQVSIGHGSSRAVMSFLKLYSREDSLCSD